jgi:hypothetical protein
MLLLLQDGTLISTLEEEEEKGRESGCSFFGLIELDNVSKVLSSIHGGRALHPGIRRTWLLLNQLYAGHGISYQTIVDFVNDCPMYVPENSSWNE